MSSFSDIINTNTPILIDFYADWCAPCKMMPPILKQVKDQYGDKIKILKIDVDKNPAVASKYNIRNIPTLMLFKEGNIKWKNAGVTQVNEIVSNVNKHL